VAEILAEFLFARFGVAAAKAALGGGSDADRGGQQEAGREGLTHHHPGRVTARHGTRIGSRDALISQVE
jgi:hypothetical protein